MSREEKDRSHERIVASASRLIRRQGVEGASVGDVMRDAGMTHGGFYKHFDSKESLLEAALDRAFDDVLAMLDPEPSSGDGPRPSVDVQAIYLSDGHLASPATGCPIASLNGDVARAAGPLKARFGSGVRKVVALLSRGAAGSERSRRSRAYRQLAMMAGAIMIARASDTDTARELLAACRAPPAR